ncbi:hypothetical protein J3U68_08030 [Snodgrassella sp. B3882]|nr:hypothetical protein [Snodgrassella sp. B3882]
MNAVENNALINIKGESKLNPEERKINDKLKKAGVQIADDYQKRYDACVTDQCRQQVEKDYRKASEEANKIILNLYMTGQLTEEESKILLTSYATKMMQGAGESQRARGSRIININANEWIPAARMSNEYFHQITMTNLVKQMKRSGKSDEQIATRVLQYELVANYQGSYSVMQQQVDALMNGGVGIDAVIQAAVLRAGRKLTNQEIRLIKERYNAKWNAGKNTPVKMLKKPNKGLKNESNANKGTTVVKPTVTAELEVNGVKFKDTNQKARPADKANANESTLIADKIRDKEIATGKELPNWNMANAHAEIGAIQQAHNAGLAKGADLKINVTGKAICSYCRSDIVSAAKAADVKSITIYEAKTGLTYYWRLGMKKLEVQK